MIEEKHQQNVSDRCKTVAHELIDKIAMSDPDECVKYTLSLNNLSAAAERFSKIKGSGWSGSDDWRNESDQGGGDGKTFTP